ncbi:MAG TPA: tetratricopeptide repeat protein, partial [Thermoanaerobaculia bacterium]|nr:tetratricopeptide repeat protein [Thermoanaerobaculia bacterium]
MSQPARRAILHGLAFLLAAGAAHAQLPGTMFGQVFDDQGQPIAGVKIVLTNPESPSFRQEETTDDRGRYTVFVASSLPAYTLQMSKEGFQPISLNGVKIPARQRTRRNFDLTPAAAAAAPTQQQGEEAATGGGIVKIYNEGVLALNANDLVTAKAKFAEAIEKNSEYGQAYGGMARVLWKEEAWQEALDNALKSLELHPDDTEIHQVLYAAYSGLGQKDKADEILKRMQADNPEKAGLNLFNQGADLYNAGQVAEAKAIFEQILQTQPDHAKTHYMLGLCYVGEDDKAKAKEHLGRFLELAPDDPDAATAQE